MSDKKAFFIADTHLSSTPTARTSLVLSFVDMVVREKGDLYILGDLFDFWANNRRLTRNYQSIFKALQRLGESGAQAHFLIGNRDFLLDSNTLQRFNIAFLGEEAEILLDGRRVLLAHGHTLCLNDTGFFEYKQRMWPIFKFLDTFLPGPIENFIARKFIIKSKKVISSQDQARFQFTMEHIENRFADGIDTIICGHRHQEVQHRSGGHRFFALPAWQDDAGPYLVYADGDFRLETFKG